MQQLYAIISYIMCDIILYFAHYVVLNLQLLNCFLWISKLETKQNVVLSSEFIYFIKKHTIGSYKPDMCAFIFDELIQKI